MLCDCVESASRTLSEPTPARIEQLVRDLSHRRLVDGQFDDSPLTLRELRTVEDSIIKSLNAIYHGRISYPSLRGEARDGRPLPRVAS
jgi:membrane-associated HD superfamily phosphohydrolase